MHRLGTVRYGYNWRPPQVVAKVPALLHVVIQSAGILRESFHLGRGAQKHHIPTFLVVYLSLSHSLIKTSLSLNNPLHRQQKPLTAFIMGFTDFVSETGLTRMLLVLRCLLSLR